MNHEIDLRQFDEEIGLKFKNRDLLLMALTHSSFSAENQIGYSNERLEFLGDSVLEFLVTDELFSKKPDLNEGDLAKARSSVVSSKSLASIAREISLGNYLILGKGADTSGARDIDSILENSLEALIAAVYLDQGLEVAKEFVLKIFKSALNLALKGDLSQDLKTVLQERSVRIFKELPVYRVIAESGPLHERRFEVEVSLAGKMLAIGKGSSKKRAEQEAARIALRIIEGEQS